MGRINQPLPVKLVLPMLSAHEELFALAERDLAALYGPVDFRSELLPFAHTRYYEAEFGPRLLRRFLTFERLIDPGDLAAVKRCTNALEERWSEAGRRRINLDPGYLSQAKLVLATTKDYAHRIYIGQGIYAEVTLNYRDRDFCSLPWTYPDYATEEYRQIFRAIRQIYIGQIRAYAHSFE